MNRILVTGGCGFVGTNMCLALVQAYSSCQIIAYDNFHRSGSAVNAQVLEENRVAVVRGDVRDFRALSSLGQLDLIIMCAAEPSVLSGLDEQPSEVIDINLMGTVRTLDLARKSDCPIIFMSSSRVYSHISLNNLPFAEQESRFVWKDHQFHSGINETFDTLGPKSIYGTTKFCAEQIIQEYVQHHRLKAIILRAGVLGGPYQMGKVDQGVIGLWCASHLYGLGLSYIGFGGHGKQVRDLMHIDDLTSLILRIIPHMALLPFQTLNVGGGIKRSVSLLELTELVQQISKKKVPIKKEDTTRPADVRIYYTDDSKLRGMFDWTPQRSVEDIVSDTVNWVARHHDKLAKYLCP